MRHRSRRPRCERGRLALTYLIKFMITITTITNATMAQAGDPLPVRAACHAARLTARLENRFILPSLILQLARAAPFAGHDEPD